MVGAPPQPSSATMHTIDSAVSGVHSKKHLLNLLKRSKSKEQQLNSGSRTQRQTGNGGDLKTGNGASKSIFNNSYKDLKPSKSVDLTSSTLQAADHSNDLLEELEGVFSGGASYDMYVFRAAEKVEQVACGSIHSLIRTN